MVGVVGRVDLVEEHKGRRSSCRDAVLAMEEEGALKSRAEGFGNVGSGKYARWKLLLLLIFLRAGLHDGGRVGGNDETLGNGEQLLDFTPRKLFLRSLSS